MQCFLTCVYGSHPDVFLPNGKAVVIGRMPELKLVDPLCSRSQLQLTANYNCKYVCFCASLKATCGCVCQSLQCLSYFPFVKC